MAAEGVVPEVRDGLTPGCRRALEALGPGTEYRPAAQVVDDALRMTGRDGRRRAIYGELVRMARDWELRLPLVDARGNLGSINGDGAASADYTQMRLTAAGAELLEGRFPGLLVNGSFALATGTASSIPPHNLREVAAATIACIDDPEIGLDGLLRHVPGPDFPTGGIVVGDGLREAYATGRGAVTVRARADVETDPRGADSIVVSELAFGTVSGGRDGVLAEIVRAVKSRRVEGVAGVGDQSDELGGLRIVIALEPGAAPAPVLERLYAHTRLQTTLPLQLVAAVAGAERTLSLRDAIALWIEQRSGDAGTQTIRDELLDVAAQCGDARRTEIV